MPFFSKKKSGMKSVEESRVAEVQKTAEESRAADSKPDLPRREPENLVVVETPEFAGEREYTNSLQRLSDSRVRGLNPNELRAVGYDRGYWGPGDKFSAWDRKKLQDTFLASQAEDPRLHEAPGVERPAVEPVAPVSSPAQADAPPSAI